MKRKSDPRHKIRVEAIKQLFEKSFRNEVKLEKGTPAFQVSRKLRQIDSIIAKNAPAWPLNQVAPVDLAILRLAIWELLFKKDKVPYKVIIDEAVEIAKEYGSDSSASFINGVLGAIVKSIRIDGEPKS